MSDVPFGRGVNEEVVGFIVPAKPIAFRSAAGRVLAKCLFFRIESVDFVSVGYVWDDIVLGYD